MPSLLVCQLHGSNMRSRNWTTPLLFVLAVQALAGCGGQTTGAIVPTTVTALTTRAHLASDSSSGALLYVTTRRTVYILSYPNGQVVGSFHEGPGHAHFVCADPSDGSVFITDAFLIRKFAHGETRRILTLQMPGKYFANGCAVDAVELTGFRGGLLISDHAA